MTQKYQLRKPFRKASPYQIRQAQTKINVQMHYDADQEAILFASIKGQKSYPSTIPCRTHHLTRRLVDTHACLTCVNLLIRAREIDNPT